MTPAVALDQTSQTSTDVVIIDDDTLTLEIVAWALRSSKSKHRLFVDPDIAMTYLCQFLPRVLIVDYYMPQINGIDFVKKLQARVDIASCEVYLCSAIEPARDQLEQLHDLGINMLDKTIICDRSALLALVGCDQYATGY